MSVNSGRRSRFFSRFWILLLFVKSSHRYLRKSQRFPLERLVVGKIREPHAQCASVSVVERVVVTNQETGLT